MKSFLTALLLLSSPLLKAAEGGPAIRDVVVVFPPLIAGDLALPERALDQGVVPPARVAAMNPTLRYAGSLLAVVGVGLLAGGSYYGWQARDADGSLGQSGVTQVDAAGLDGRSARLSRRANVLFAVGGGFAGAGGGLVLWDLVRASPSGDPPHVEVAPVRRTFILEGSVVEEGSGRPLSNAVVAGEDESLARIVVDSQGRFASPPVEEGGGLLRLVASAPGYADQQLVVPRGPNGDLVAFRLTRAGEKGAACLVGSLKDASTGQVVRGVVFLPRIGVSVATDDQGKFRVEVAPGRYEVRVSSKNHLAQTKQLQAEAGDTIVLNLDMHPLK